MTQDPPPDWTRAEPLGPPAAPVPPPPITGIPIPYRPPYPEQQPPVAQYVPMPPPPPQQITYVQPVARKGLTGPHAAIYITLLVLGVLIVLPVLCCLGFGVLGAVGGGAHPYPTP